MKNVLEFFAFANTPPKPEQIYLSTSQMANRLGISRTTVWRYRKHDPNFPKPIKFNSTTTRWLLSDIQTWEQSR